MVPNRATHHIWYYASRHHCLKNNFNLFLHLLVKILLKLRIFYGIYKIITILKVGDNFTINKFALRDNALNKPLSDITYGFSWSSYNAIYLGKSKCIFPTKDAKHMGILKLEIYLIKKVTELLQIIYYVHK